MSFGVLGGKGVEQSGRGVDMRSLQDMRVCMCASSAWDFVSQRLERSQRMCRASAAAYSCAREAVASYGVATGERGGMCACAISATLSGVASGLLRKDRVGYGHPTLPCPGGSAGERSRPNKGLVERFGAPPAGCAGSSSAALLAALLLTSTIVMSCLDGLQRAII